MIRAFIENLLEIPRILAALKRASKTIKAEGIDPFESGMKCAYYTLKGRFLFGRTIAEQMTGKTTSHVSNITTLIDWTFEPTKELVERIRREDRIEILFDHTLVGEA